MLVFGGEGMRVTGTAWPQRVAVYLGGAGALVLLTGCPNPNLYTTPRTLEPGKLQWNLAGEGIGINYNETITTGVAANGTPITAQQSTSVWSPMLPSFGVRYGLVDGLELGAHVQNLDSLEADLKVRLLKGTFDLAVDPGVQGFYYSITVNNSTTSIAVTYLHLPLLMGVNFSKSVSFVASPGFAWAVVSGSATDANGTQGASATSGAIGRLGLGFDFRIGSKFALHPEITFLKAFSSTDATMYIFGLGFNFGAMPDYSDLEGGGGGNTPPPPGQPPPT
jgi:hypothetical protein